MDDLDHGLIAELRRDGRASISELADRLQVSRATVRLRLERASSC
jgi:DNA-binding Lrp family transcriptional regulator